MTQGTILPYNGKTPKIAESAFIAPGAVIIGDVEIGEETNIWYNVVIRGDVNTVRIGKRTNIQDGTVCHVTYKTGPLSIGDEVTIGHNAIIHACTLENRSFVGMGATVMDGAVVQTEAMLAAGALLSPKKQVSTHELWSGVPAKLMRAMTEDEVSYMPWSAEHYVKLGQAHKTSLSA